MSVFILSMCINAAFADPTHQQLEHFKNKTMGHIGVLTTTGGSPVEVRDMTALSSQLLRNSFFMDTMTGFVREKIPDRIVHAKGTGAFGYFEVTHNVTDICKANLFSEVGKKTPVAVRFSHGSLERGEPDFNRDSRGFAVKFYTEEGNFDIVGFNTPMFMTKDPLLFMHIMRAVKRNPVTNVLDHTMIWDITTLRPEIIFFFMYIFGDNGIPVSFSHMPGYSIHTYQVINDSGESHFVRFHFIPDRVHSLVTEDDIAKAKTNPDYLAEALYNEIGNGDFPSWTLKVQVLSMEDVKNADFDVFDITKVLSKDKYPLRPIGRLVLNRNPTNYFADVEQAAFCPANLVPGVLGAPDKVFEARILAYRDAHAYRLGVNANKIKVNFPFNLLSMNRDGRPVGDNGGNSPNYFPNTFNGALPYSFRPKLITILQYDDSNLEQPSKWFQGLPSDARKRFVTNLVSSSLSKINNEDVRKRAINLFTSINRDLGFMVAKELSKYL